MNDVRKGLLRPAVIVGGFAVVAIVQGERVARGWPIVLAVAVLIGLGGAWNDARRRRAAEGEAKLPKT